MARGRNPWIWGGAALVLGIPWPNVGLPILGVAPVLFLMFFVKPASQNTRPRHNSCSRCASPHTPGQNFCTKCGWDLSREYSPENSDTVLASEMHQGQPQSTATAERPAEPAQHDVPANSSPPVSEQQQPAPADESAQAPDPEAAPAYEPPVAEPTFAQEADPAEPEPAPAPAEEQPARPWGFPQPGPAPTAEGMTARGAALLSEGRLQEAIDQFTKAIALDPKHKEAFERRAEAYTRQGRGERAEEDYRTVQALNAGS